MRYIVILTVLIFFFFGEGVAGLRFDDATSRQGVLLDSVSSFEKKRGWADGAKIFQNRVCEVFEDSKELMKELERLDNKKLRHLDLNIRKVMVVDNAVFDETGLILGGVKYFIRIWKHPPKESFNMPTLKMK